MLDNLISIAFLFQIFRVTIPYLLPSVGAVFSEKGGVVNIALEGILLISAFFTTVGTYITQNPLVGLLFGIAAGLLLALIHSVTVITFKANQIVSGIALNLLAFGSTKFFCKIIFSSSSNSARIPGLESFQIPLLGNPFLVLCIVILIYSQIVIYRTRFGLRLRSVGENPSAADSLGINVSRIRYTGVLLSGLFASLAGAWLAFDQHSFTDGMSAGRGYIALAAMIIGKWNPVKAAGACLLFGFAESFANQMQNSFIPTQFIQMLPYVLTMIVLAGFIGKATPPAADGIPYEKN